MPVLIGDAVSFDGWFNFGGAEMSADREWTLLRIRFNYLSEMLLLLTITQNYTKKNVGTVLAEICPR